jgi:hypothetical protein
MMKSFFKTAATKDAPPPKKKGVKPEDAQEVAGFLLSLKNQRSVSPDPNDALTPEEEASESVVAAAEEEEEVEPPADAAVEAPSSGVITGYAGPPPVLPSFLPVMGSAFAPRAFTYPTPMPLPPAPSSSTKKKKNKKATLDIADISLEDFQEIDLSKFVDPENHLVLMKDRGLVPDALFVSMLQMKPCQLTQADRVGCYKSRDLGFIGMCCKHCNGQPGFGRYFPNSVRSLAQTTTSQTILKHISSKCRFCPPNVREAVVELQRQQALKEAATAAGVAGLAVSSEAGRPRYGSRKIFFHRVWSRLHAGTLGIQVSDDYYEDYPLMKSDGETASLQEESAESIADIVAAAVSAEELGTSAKETVEVMEESLKRSASSNKRMLPLAGKNKKIKVDDVPVVQEAAV